MKISNFNTVELEGTYNNSTSITLELVRFMEDAINQKAIRLNETDAKAQFPSLVKEGLIAADNQTINGGGFSIAHHPLIYYALFRVFSQKLDFSYTPDISRLLSFHKHIIDYFTIDKRPMSPYLTHGMPAYLILMGTKEEVKKLTEQGKTLVKEDPHFKVFYKTYFDNFDSFDQNFSSLWDMTAAFGSQEGKPDIGTSNNLWPTITKVFTFFFRANESKLKEYQSFVMAKFGAGPIEDYLAGVCLQLIHAQIPLSVNEILTYMDNPLLFHISLVLLAQVPLLDEEQIELTKSKLQKVEVTSKQYREALKLTIAILWGPTVLSKEQIQFFEQFIIDGVQSKVEDIVQNAISVMAESRKLSTFFSNTLIKLIADDNYRDSYDQVISFFYNAHGSIDLFFDFLVAYSLKFGLKFQPAKFKDCIYILHEGNKPQFEQRVIQMMTHEEGEVRYAGNKLLYSLHDICQINDLSFDLHTLDSLKQYKFVVTLSNDRLHAKEQITYMAPLLSSTSDIVKELVLCKLEELIQGYKQQVFEYLETHLKDLLDKQSIITRLEYTLEEVYALLRVKKGVRELTPEVQYPRLMRSYNQALTKSHQKSDNKRDRKPEGIWSLFTPVLVARGGGVLHPDGSIHAFGKVSASFTIPRTLFVSPEIGEYELFFFFTTNWTEEFEPWEQTILSSGNI